MKSLLQNRIEFLCLQKESDHLLVVTVMAANSHTDKTKPTTFNNNSWVSNNTAVNVKHHSSGKSFDILMGPSYTCVEPVGTNRPT